MEHQRNNYESTAETHIQNKNTIQSALEEHGIHILVSDTQTLRGAYLELYDEIEIHLSALDRFDRSLVAAGITQPLEAINGPGIEILAGIQELRNQHGLLLGFELLLDYMNDPIELSMRAQVQIHASPLLTMEQKDAYLQVLSATCGCSLTPPESDPEMQQLIDVERARVDRLESNQFSPELRRTIAQFMVENFGTAHESTAEYIQACVIARIIFKAKSIASQIFLGGIDERFEQFREVMESLGFDHAAVENAIFQMYQVPTPSRGANREMAIEIPIGQVNHQLAQPNPGVLYELTPNIHEVGPSTAQRTILQLVEFGLLPNLARTSPIETIQRQCGESIRSYLASADVLERQLTAFGTEDGDVDMPIEQLESRQDELIDLRDVTLSNINTLRALQEHLMLARQLIRVKDGSDDGRETQIRIEGSLLINEQARQRMLTFLQNNVGYDLEDIKDLDFASEVLSYRVRHELFESTPHSPELGQDLAGTMVAFFGTEYEQVPEYIELCALARSIMVMYRINIVPQAADVIVQQYRQAGHALGIDQDILERSITMLQMQRSEYPW